MRIGIIPQISPPCRGWANLSTGSAHPPAGRGTKHRVRDDIHLEGEGCAWQRRAAAKIAGKRADLAGQGEPSIQACRHGQRRNCGSAGTRRQAGGGGATRVAPPQAESTSGGCDAGGRSDQAFQGPWTGQLQESPGGQRNSRRPRSRRAPPGQALRGHPHSEGGEDPRAQTKPRRVLPMSLWATASAAQSHCDSPWQGAQPTAPDVRTGPAGRKGGRGRRRHRDGERLPAMPDLSSPARWCREAAAGTGRVRRRRLSPTRRRETRPRRKADGLHMPSPPQGWGQASAYGEVRGGSSVVAGGSTPNAVTDWLHRH